MGIQILKGFSLSDGFSLVFLTPGCTSTHQAASRAPWLVPDKLLTPAEEILHVSHKSEKSTPLEKKKLSCMCLISKEQLENSIKLKCLQWGLLKHMGREEKIKEKKISSFRAVTEPFRSRTSHAQECPLHLQPQ